MKTFAFLYVDRGALCSDDGYVAIVVVVAVAPAPAAAATISVDSEG